MMTNGPVSPTKSLRLSEEALNHLDGQLERLDNLLTRLMYAVEPVYMERNEISQVETKDKEVILNSFFSTFRHKTNILNGYLDKLEYIIRGIDI